MVIPKSIINLGFNPGNTNLSSFSEALICNS